MNILYFLIGCSVLMALIFLGAFFWALKNGQHDDVCTPGIRVLFDDQSDAGTTNRVENKNIYPLAKEHDKNHFSA